MRKIDAFGDRLQRRYQDALGDDGRMHVDRMQSAVGRMRCLIEDLLDSSRVTTKAKPFDRVCLDEVREGVESDLQVAIESGVGEIRAVSLPVIDGDRTQLRQLLQNIVANAIKFRKPEVPPGIEIACRLWPSERVAATGTEQGERVRIAVADNGIGFEMKYAERIFGILQRLHNRSGYEGNGVGLATCRKLVERQNGALTVGSEPGIGTTFTTELPKT